MKSKQLKKKEQEKLKKTKLVLAEDAPKTT